MGRVLLSQALIALLAAASIVVIRGWSEGGLAAMAVLYGGATAMANSSLLGWRMARGRDKPHADAGRHLRSFYLSSLERFVVAAGLLAVGLVLLHLSPIALLSGFVLGQVTLLVVGLLGGIT
jgi:ATP synthase protein I